MNVRSALERVLEKHEGALYAALFLGSLMIRLAALESGPLSGKEAAEAWGAWRLLHGGAAASSSALFASFTAGLLFLAGPSHWAPRLIPAAAGALAVLLPLLTRTSRGRIEAFLFALLLALSPALCIASIMAGGTALGFLAAGFFLFYLRLKEPRPLLCGLALGLAAAAGPVGWSGLCIAAVVSLVERILRSDRPAAVKPPDAGIRSILRSPVLLAGFVLGLTGGSTGLFFFPRGFGALAAGLSGWLGAFFSGWPRIGELVLLFLGYEPIALAFGAAGFILLRKGLLDQEDRFWGMFAAVAAVWVLLRPAAFPDEALWIVLPLLVLGARVLGRILESPFLEERPRFVAIQGGVVLALAVFTVFNLAAFEATASWVHLLLALIGILGGFLPGLLTTEDWQRALLPSLLGLGLAWFTFLAAVEVGAGWNAAIVRRNSANEIWQTETAAADLLRLHSTLEQISEWQTGVPDELAVVIQMPEESALGWELLTYPPAEYPLLVDMLSTPAMLVAPYEKEEDAVVSPHLAVVYRGQAFGYIELRAWSGWPPDLIGWLLYRRGPVERTRVILWVRGDVLVPEEGAGK
jgi:hypothetical protein